jgi:phosphate transport system permease protein
MRLFTRKLLDKSFSATGIVSLVLMIAGLAVILIPIFYRGSQAIIFRGTIEWRRYFLEDRDRGNPEKINAQIARAEQAREPVYRMLAQYENPAWEYLAEVSQSDQVSDALRQHVEERDLPLYLVLPRVITSIGWSDYEVRKELQALEEDYASYFELKDLIRKLLGPFPYDPERDLTRVEYGATRWDKAREALHTFLYKTEYRPTDGGTGFMKPVEVSRAKVYEHEGVDLQDLSPEETEQIRRDRELARIFPYIKDNLNDMLLPRWVVYWRFFFDKPDTVDRYFFGGIWPSFLGTLYLGIGTMLLAGPVGVIAAIYLTQYAGTGRFISFLRICISTLAGVPSVVFGLFGLAFFINWMHISGNSPSIMIGCMTLALIVLPTVIRASEEAIKAVPGTYKEASMGLGATKWQTIVKVILPSALPGIITSIIISMGRAAGETAPILFTAAVAVGQPVAPLEIFTTPTPALPYSIWMSINEPASTEVRHVQFGMVMTLILLVLLLNIVAIILRARISSKLRG